MRKKDITVVDKNNVTKLMRILDTECKN